MEAWRFSLRIQHQRLNKDDHFKTWSSVRPIKILAFEDRPLTTNKTLGTISGDKRNVFIVDELGSNDNENP